MELRELRYFLAVAQEQSITKAAEYLYIAQPSLSKQMQNLEKEIGRPLFVRGSRKITLTETGMLLKKRAEEMMDLYEKTEAEISAPEGDICGDVHIGSGESYAVRTVAKAAKEVMLEHPRIKFDFFSGDANDVTEKLDKGLLDFGILVDYADLSEYNSMRLPLADSWGVLMRKDSPLAEKDTVAPEDLSGQPLICSQQSMEKHGVIKQWFGEISDLNVRAKVNLVYNASVLVREGVGYAVTLARLVNTTGDSDLCFRPISPAIETHLDIVWKKYAVFSKPSECFLNKLREILRSEAPAS